MLKPKLHPAFAPTVSGLLVLLAVGCGSANQVDQGTTPDANAGAAHRSTTAQTSGQELAQNDCQIEAVYYAYDSSDLDNAARETLARDADCMQRQNVQRASVVGMTDARGTEEYNLALGDRRARAAVQYLSTMGVERNRLDMHSVGEEFAAGRDESGWARDRRSQIQSQ